MSSDILAIAQSVGDLVARATGALDELESLGEPQGPGLEPAHDLRIALLGHHEAGKSSLVNAMTSADLDVGAGVTTTTTTVHRWGQVLVVDTPGVGSGTHEAHDLVADDAVLESPLVLCVLTKSGLTPSVAKYLRQVLDGYAKRDHALVVVNKIDETDNDPAGIVSSIRERALEEGLSLDGLDVVTCSAKEALEGDGTALDELTTALWGLAASVGETARTASPAIAAAERLERYVHERTTAVASMVRHVEERKHSVEECLAEARRGHETLQNVVGSFEVAVWTRAEELLLAVESGEAEEDDWRALDEGLAREADRRWAEVSEVVGGLEEALGHVLDTSEAPDGPPPPESGERVSLQGPGSTGSAQPWWRAPAQDAAAELLTGFDRVLGEFTAPTGSRPGQPAHALARRVRALFRRENRPYDIVRTAEKLEDIGRIGEKAAKVASPFARAGVDLALEEAGRLADDRVTKRRREKAHAVIDSWLDRCRAPMDGAVEWVAMSVEALEVLAGVVVAEQERLARVHELLDEIAKLTGELRDLGAAVRGTG